MASVSATALFFLSLELVKAAVGEWVEVIGADEEEEKEVEDDAAAAAALIRSDSFCFFFFADAELWDDCEGDNGASLCKDAAGVVTS